MKLSAIISVFLIIIICGLTGNIFYLEGKAILAQFLLKNAWHKSKDLQTAVKPWPWADTYPAGELTIPRLNIHQVILEGHSGEALAFGPGQIISNNSISLAGHRDSHFAFLKQLKIGDRLILEDKKITKAYYISNFYIQDTRTNPTHIPQENTLTLITCYPFDSLLVGGPLRYIVVAEPLIQSQSQSQNLKKITAL